MKGSCACVGSVFIILVMFGSFVSSRHTPHRTDSDDSNPRSLQAKAHKLHDAKQGPSLGQEVRRPGTLDGKLNTVQVAGSRLPDCSHACGSCTPCRLVMVSFVCSKIQEAESCPMAYKCMCHNRSYPVP